MITVYRILLIGFIGFGTLNDSAQASFRIWKTPYRAAVCEALLTNPVLLSLSSDENPLPSLRALRLKLSRQSTLDVGPGFDPVGYNGLTSEISDSTRAKIIARLKGIEEQMKSGSLDNSIVVLEFRGEKYHEAIESFQAANEELMNVYAEEVGKAAPLPRRVFGGGIALWMAYAGFSYPLVLFQGIVDGHPGQAVGALAGTFIILNYFKENMRHFVTRYDFTNVSLVRGLKNLHPYEVVALSSNLVLPTAFHRLLMQSLKRDEDIADARVEALKTHGDSFAGNVIRGIAEFLSGPKQKKLVQSAGDVERHVMTDHFAYYDDKVKEPVWLFVYRAQRTHPTPRKPKKSAINKPIEDSDLEPIPTR